jgi:hypothetical protein
VNLRSLFFTGSPLYHYSTPHVRRDSCKYKPFYQIVQKRSNQIHNSYFLERLFCTTYFQAGFIAGCQNSCSILRPFDEFQRYQEDTEIVVGWDCSFTGRAPWNNNWTLEKQWPLGSGRDSIPPVVKKYIDTTGHFKIPLCLDLQTRIGLYIFKSRLKVVDL